MQYIPFQRPHVPKSTVSILRKIIDSGWLTTGPYVKKFENRFKVITRSKHGIAVSSGTAALHLAYLAHCFGPGDEVIVPSFIFCSVVNMLVYCSAKPVFCDIDENTLCADPKDIENKISKRTKGIVIVHYAGMPADMDKINKLAQRNNIVVIEDAAHAFMSKYKGSYIGYGKNTVCFSFYVTKNLTTIEGGLITTSSASVANFAVIASLHGISKDAWKRYDRSGDWKYDVIFPGYKYDMTDIGAVIGLEQLKQLRSSIKRRTRLAREYKRRFAGNPVIILPSDPPYENSRYAWHLFVIRLRPFELKSSFRQRQARKTLPPNFFLLFIG